MDTDQIIIIIVASVAALLLGWFIHASLRSRRERIRCARELPGLAEHLGLKYEKNRRMGQIMGTVTGKYRGREILVAPDSGRSPVSIGRRDWLSFPADLRTEKPTHWPEEGWVSFDSGDLVVDRFFRQRYAKPEYAEIMTSTPEIMDALGAFLRRWAAKISWLEIGTGSARWRLKIPPLFADSANEDMWQPVEDLREFIPEMVTLLDTLQEHAPPKKED